MSEKSLEKIMSTQLLQAYINRVQICPNPIFIIGSPRSGTTILGQALAKHSELWTSDESHILFGLFGDGRVEAELEKWLARPSSNWLRTQAVDRDEFLGFLGIGLNALFTSRSQGKRWIDHTPYYAWMAEVLAHMFPGAFFLHILRDGRRVVNSMVNVHQTLTEGERMEMQKGQFLPPWATDFREACKTWRHSVELSMEFCERHPARCLTVVHEALTAEPHKLFRDIFEVVGVRYEDDPVKYFQGNRINTSFPEESPTHPPAIDASSNPWSNWTVDQKLIFYEEAAPTLLKFSLATENDVKLSPYDELCLRVREVVRDMLPPKATVAVVSKGDDQLLTMDGRTAWHFPQTETGEYTGYYPTDSNEAIAQLEAVRSKGAQFLLFPSTAFWWLEHYASFKQYLEHHYRIISDVSETCLIYSLMEPPTEDQLAASKTSLWSLLENPPMFHRDESGKPILYALGNEVLHMMAEHINPSSRTLETGAGLTTVLFALKGACHTCIVPDQELVDRIKGYCDQHQISIDRIDFRISRSENLLPYLQVTDLDMVLIDGGHGFPVPIIDWYFTVEKLKIGGQLIIDDTHLWTGRILKEFLLCEPEWELVQEWQKTAVFKKLKDGSQLKEWGGQPYTVLNSELSGSVLSKFVQGLLANRGVERLTMLGDSLTKRINVIEGIKRHLIAQEPDPQFPLIYSYDKAEKLKKYIVQDQAPWNNHQVQLSGIPGMITGEEKRYYAYLGRFYAGQGKVVELGPWLGCSTFYILQGLLLNPNFSSQKLYVFDDFIWRSAWMDPAYSRAATSGHDKPEDRQSFRHLFDAYTQDFADLMIVEQQRIATFFENQHLPQLSWNNGPIEICYIDCGRTFEANEAWYKVLLPYFIREKTLLVMQDWQSHKEVPRKWYNQVKDFTDSKGGALELVNELYQGSIATFLYRGQ